MKPPALYCAITKILSGTVVRIRSRFFLRIVAALVVKVARLVIKVAAGSLMAGTRVQRVVLFKVAAVAPVKSRFRGVVVRVSC